MREGKAEFTTWVLGNRKGKVGCVGEGEEGRGRLKGSGRSARGASAFVIDAQVAFISLELISDTPSPFKKYALPVLF